MKAVFQGIAAQIADQMLDERVHERRCASSTGSSRAVSATALLGDSAPDGLPEDLSGLHINPGISWLTPLFPEPHEPADGTENEARFLDRSRTRSWTVEVRVS
jgi:hypothetical protein